MSKKVFFNPYFDKYIDKEEIINSDVDLCDASGYLPLKEQINIIEVDSELNYQFRLGQIDSYNSMKELMNNPEFSNTKQLIEEFETSDFNNEQLLKYRNGDLIDKQSAFQEAYNAGFRAGFFPTGSSEASEPDTQTSGVQQENNQTVTTDNKTE